MIKQIKKYIKNQKRWITVICEQENTIYNTLDHLQIQNPDALLCVCDLETKKE